MSGLNTMTMGDAINMLGFFMIVMGVMLKLLLVHNRVNKNGWVYLIFGGVGLLVCMRVLYNITVI